LTTRTLSSTAERAAAERAPAHRWLALAVLCAGLLMIVLDGTITTVALPSIQTDLGFSQSSLGWVVNAYLIPFGGLLLLAGRLGDLLGRRRMFITGLIVFSTASLVCGLSMSPAMLVGARFVQGIGGAMTQAVILGMIVTMFPAPREQAQAIGVFSFAAAAGGSVGLLTGGAVTQAINWHWIFFINVPIGIATVFLTLRLVTADRGLGLAGGADVLGAVLVTSSLMLGVYTIVETADYGWISPHTLGLGAVSIALLVAFVRRQARVSNPLMPLGIFRSRNVTGANLVQCLVTAGLFGFFFMSVLYMQRVLGYDAIETGLAILPVAIMIAVLSLGLSARLNTRFGARTILVPGLVLMAAGLALLSRVPVDGTFATDLLPVMLVLGFGAGLCFPALMTLAMADATPDDSGLASGLANTTQQLGSALGLAVLAALATSRTAQLVASGQSNAAALTGGYHLAFQISTGLMAVAVVLALAVIPSRSAAQAASTVVEADADAAQAEVECA
jgi:EmrB/QacA subfamily drug resistance transporter